MTKKRKIILIEIIGILIDRITKMIVKKHIVKNTFIKIIGNFFRITYTENTGAAWSILKNKTFFLIIISLLFLIFIISCIIKDKRNTNFNTFSYGLIISGIIGNMFDRIVYHKVTDFLSFKIFGYYFPIFNIADSLIVIGTILFIIDMIQEGREESPMLKEYEKIKENTSGKNSSRARKH